MLQIVFNEISAAEISALPTLDQLEILDEFQVTPEDVERPDGRRIGVMNHDGQRSYRYRAGEWRVYFSVEGEQVIVHRVLHANSFADFLVRSHLGSGGEDEALARSPHFWKLIDEGQKARRL